MLSNLVRKRDFYAGGVITLLGGAVTLDSATNYHLGTLTHMGPGMFPFMLGIVLAFVGVLILGTAVVTPLGPDERILPADKQWRGWGCILAGPVLFIIVGEYLGLFAGTFVCVFVAALGDRTATLKGSLILGFGVALAGSLLFVYVLQSPFPMFKWDF